MKPLEKSPAAELPERLKKFRAANRLTQGQVAAALEVERSTYTYYETGRSQPSLDSLTKLALIFGVSLSELLGISNDFPTRESSKAEDEEENEEDETKRKKMFLNELTRDEQNLMINFRLLTTSQKDEVLDSFSVTPTVRKKKKQ